MSTDDVTFLGGATRKWILRGSDDDGTSWHDIHTQEVETPFSISETRSFAVNSVTAYPTYSILVLRNSSTTDTTASIGTWRLFGSPPEESLSSTAYALSGDAALQRDSNTSGVYVRLTEGRTPHSRGQMTRSGVFLGSSWAVAFDHTTRQGSEQNGNGRGGGGLRTVLWIGDSNNQSSPNSLSLILDERANTISVAQGRRVDYLGFGDQITVSSPVNLSSGAWRRVELCYVFLDNAVSVSVSGQDVIDRWALQGAQPALASDSADVIFWATNLARLRNAHLVRDIVVYPSPVRQAGALTGAVTFSGIRRAFDDPSTYSDVDPIQLSSYAQYAAPLARGGVNATVMGSSIANGLLLVVSSHQETASPADGAAFSSALESQSSRPLRRGRLEQVSAESSSRRGTRVRGKIGPSKLLNVVSGDVFLDEVGTYEFGLRSTQASELYISGQLAASWYGGPHDTTITNPPVGGTQVAVNVNRRGLHAFVCRFFELERGDECSALWKPPSSTSWSIIPETAFFLSQSRRRVDKDVGNDTAVDADVVEAFEETDALSEAKGNWTVNDPAFALSTARRYGQAPHSAGISASSTRMATVARFSPPNFDSRTGSTRPVTMAFKFAEDATSNAGGGVRLLGTDGQLVVGFAAGMSGSSSTRWTLWDGDGSTVLQTGSSASLAWTDVFLTLDWSSGIYRYQVSDGTVTRTGCRLMGSTTGGAASMVVNNYDDSVISGEEWDVTASAMHVWFDHFAFGFSAASPSWFESHRTSDALAAGGWIVHDPDLVADDTNTYPGSTSGFSLSIASDTGGANTEGPLAKIAEIVPPGYAGASRRPTHFSYLYRELSNSTGGGIRLHDSRDRLVAGFATDNPEWHMYDGETSYTNVYSSCPYQVWVRVSFTFYWEQRVFRYVIENTEGSDRAEGMLDLPTYAQDVEKLVICNNTLGAGVTPWTEALRMYMWFSDVFLGHVPAADLYHACALDGMPQLHASVADLPTGAFSCRRLFGRYQGPQVRVRRSTDAAQEDVYFDARGRNGYLADGVTEFETWAGDPSVASCYLVTWYDQSGNGRHVESGALTGDIELVTSLQQPRRARGASYYLMGSTSTTMSFPTSVINDTTSYTLFHTTRLSGSARDRVLTGNLGGNNWLSGFHHGSGRSGVAYHGSWLYNGTSIHGDAWLLSADQRNIYRSNKVTRGTITGGNSPNVMEINTYGTEISDYAIVEVIVYGQELGATTYQALEDLLIAHKADVGGAGTHDGTTMLTSFRGDVTHGGGTTYGRLNVFSDFPTVLNGGGYHVEPGGARLIIEEPGIYVCTFNISESSDAERSNVMCRWEINGVAQSEEAATGYIRADTLHHESSVHMTTYYELRTGDALALLFVQEAASNTTSPVTTLRGFSSVSVHRVST